MKTYAPEEITKNDQVGWSILFSLVYVGIFVIGLYILMMVNGELPTTIGLFDLFLIVFAAFRLVRLFVYDKIMQFFRDWFLDKEEFTDERGAIHFKRYPPIKGPRRTINDLISCPWCFGMWAGAIVPFFYFLTPWAWFPILALAISGVASLFTLLANLIGWNAEYKKREVQSKFD